jgi:anaerobic magnesium-protoporphyrin IX monomethyl ester cyclase
MRVLLLNPPFMPKFSRTSRSPAVTKGGTIYYPYWLAYATGVLEKNGFEVKLIDAPARGVSHGQVIKISKNFHPDLVVVDTSTPSIYNDTKFAEAIKNATSSFVTLVGTHVSTLPEETLRLSKKIDAVARREYDYTILELAQELEKRKRLEKVLGISFRENNRIIHNPDRPFIKNLDELPFVSGVYKKHLRIEDYFYATVFHPEVAILSGRGCPYGCSFCLYTQVFWSRTYRLRSAKNVVDELEFINNELPQVREVMFEDDSMASMTTAKRCREICKEIIKRKLKIGWVANSRADVDYETLKLMKKAGCRLLCVGYESMSQLILNKIHKGITIEMMKKFTENAKKVGLQIHGCFILGLPFDNFKTTIETIKFATKLNIDSAQFYPLMVYPGTESYDWAKENGYLITEDYSQWLTPEGWHNCMVSRPGLSNQKLVKICDKARISFYLRPNYFSKRFKLFIKNWDEAKRTFMSGKTFFKYLLRILIG